MKDSKITSTKLIVCCIALLAAVTAFAGLAFPLSVSSYFFKVSMSAFEVIRFLPYFFESGLDAFLAVMIIGEFFYSLSIIVVAGLTFMYNEELAIKSCFRICIGCLVCTSLYFIEGIVYAALEGSMTHAFIPAIIEGIIFTVFMLFKTRYLNPQPETSIITTIGSMDTAPAEENVNEAENLKLLAEYKKLLDQGVITQAEFENKKAKLLNLK